MKKNYSIEIERGRVKNGSHGTSGGPCWAFFVVCPVTKTELKIIAGDGSDWLEIPLPIPRFEHVSVSTENRCPSWKEMAWVKDQFFDEEECVVQYHPPKSRYVNKHPNVLHLWRVVDGVFPMPPLECV